MPDTPVPPGTYAGQGRSPIVWAYLCAPCGGYVPIGAETGENFDYCVYGRCQGCGAVRSELHRFPAHIDSAAGCSDTWKQHPRVTGDLAAAGSAAELVRWMHEQAAEMKARSRQDLTPEQCAALDEPPGFARRGPVVVLEGERARQAQLASGLAMAIAHIAVMRPEVPHA